MLHTDIVNRLRQMLVDGNIPPGSRIAERELCAEFAISRTPLREALKVLAAEGLVVLLPNRGARAARITEKDIRDLFDLCGALEAAAGELACERIKDDVLARIQSEHAEMSAAFEARDLPAYYGHNRAIHELIVEASDNPILSSLYASVNQRIRRSRFVAPMTDEHWRTAMLEHDAILNCLERRDGTAIAIIMKKHLRHKQEQASAAGFAENTAVEPGEGRRRTRRRHKTANAIGGSNA